MRSIRLALLPMMCVAADMLPLLLFIDSQAAWMKEGQRELYDDSRTGQCSHHVTDPACE